MKIGCPNHPRKDLLEEITWIGSQGFDFLDLFFEPESATPDNLPIERIGELLAQYRLGVVGHTAWYLPIGSPIKSLRQAAVQEAARTFPLLQQLGGGYVTIHGNWPSPKLFTIDEAIGFQSESLRQLVDLAAKSSIAVMYEPIPDARDTIPTMQKLLDAVPGLMLHIDIGHANIHGKTPADYITALHQRLVHIHLHDNNGVEDLHLPMGCGNIDWPRTLKALKANFDGTITLEIFSPDRDYLLLSKAKLERLWAQA